MVKIPTSTDNRDARVEAVSNLIEICGRIQEALSCAECCETDADLDTNIDDAIDAAEEFLKHAKTARAT